MRRKLLQSTLFVVLLALLVLLTACGKPKQEQQASTAGQSTASTAAQSAVEEVPLAGDYVIDITNLGMALQFYLRINEDNSFILAPNRQFTSDRGTGKIGEREGTYVMIYSDSTSESPKTATFEREGHNLVFKTTLPYGSSNIIFELQDEENPDIVYRLIANKYIYEEYYDTYLAFVEEDGREYGYMLKLQPGALYSFVSSLGGSQVYSETGTFKVTGNTLVITPEGGAELTGSASADKVLELEVKPQAEAERRKTVFRVATTAEHAGKWYAQSASGELAVLTLDYFGGYVFNLGDQSERGSFTADQRTISLTPEGGEGKQGSKTPYTLEAEFGSEQLLFFSEKIIGQFSGATMAAESYSAQLELTYGGEYTLVIADEENEAELLRETGTFQITAGPMAYQLNLQSGDGTKVGDIWPTGFNMAFTIDGTEYRFLLTSSAR